MPKNLISGRLRKIGLVAPGSVSEFFLLLPAILALKKSLPKARLTYFGKEWHVRFLNNYPGIFDDVQEIPPLSLFKEKNAGAQKYLRTIQNAQFDLMLQLHDGGSELNELINLMQPKNSLGLAELGWESLDFNIPFDPFQHQSIRAFEVLRAIDINVLIDEVKLNAVKKETAGLAEFFVPDRRKLAILHPGNHDRRFCWPAEYFGLVGNWLATQGYRIVVTGSIIERDLVESVLYTIDTPAEGLVGVLSLTNLVGLIRQADLVVSNDTAPLHIAEELSVLSTGVYWAGKAFSRAPLWRERHRAVISWQNSCPKCKDTNLIQNWPEIVKGPKNCRHEFAWTDSITPDQTIDEIETLLIQNSQTSWI